MTEHFDNYKILSYFQSTLRNIGMYTAASLSFILASYNINVKTYRFVLIYASLTFIVMSIITGFYLLQDITSMNKRFRKENTLNYTNKWKILPILMIIVNLCILIFGTIMYIKSMCKSVYRT
jgi:uncharacterized membrane protein YidH (DUF202 family)